MSKARQRRASKVRSLIRGRLSPDEPIRGMYLNLAEGPLAHWYRWAVIVGAGAGAVIGARAVRPSGWRSPELVVAVVVIVLVVVLALLTPVCDLARTDRALYITKRGPFGSLRLEDVAPHNQVSFVRLEGIQGGIALRTPSRTWMFVSTLPSWWPFSVPDDTEALALHLAESGPSR